MDISSTGMEFVWIPALKLWVGKYEVSNGEYRKKAPSHDSKSAYGGSLNGDRQPVVYVDFYDARAYADWLTEQDKDQLGALQYRVISETRWQTVAHCGDGRVYPWGNNLPPCYGNYYGSEGVHAPCPWLKGYTDDFKVTCDVEKSGRNNLGLYGVGRNVWEYCPSHDSGRIFGALHGVSWITGDYKDLRCAERIDKYETMRCSDLGFRLALSR